MGALHLTLPDLLVVAGYFVVVLWIGFYFRRRLEGVRDYFAGGHAIPWWLAGISHYMSSFSAFSFIAYSQIGYSYGWVAVTLFWATVPACLVGGRVFASRWRRARIITPVQFLESRFNAFLRQLFAWAGIPMKIFDDALKIFATGLFVGLGVKMNIHWAIIVCGVVMVAYTFFGGLWALVVTDFAQFLMKALAMLLLLPLALWGAGGMKAAFSGLPPHFLNLSGGPYGWIYIFGFAVLMMISYNGTWALAQKYYSVRDEREARKAAYFAALLNFLGAPVMIAPSLVARSLLPDLVAQHRTADVYVLLILRLLPAGMIGIIVAAMFSATMATVSADFSAIASVLTEDVYHRLVDPKASGRLLMRVGRLITLTLGVVTVALSIWIAVGKQESLFHTMVTVFGLFMAPTLLPILAGLTIRRLTWKGALAGFAAGLACGVLMLAVKTWYLPRLSGVSSEWANYTFEGISILLNTAVTLLAMWLGTVWLSSDAEERARGSDFFLALDRPVTADEVPRSQTVSPMLAISGTTLGVGGLLALAAVFCQSSTARFIDLSVGAALVVLGVVFYKKRSKAQARCSAAFEATRQ